MVISCDPISTRCSAPVSGSMMSHALSRRRECRLSSAVRASSSAELMPSSKVPLFYVPEARLLMLSASAAGRPSVSHHGRCALTLANKRLARRLTRGLSLICFARSR